MEKAETNAIKKALRYIKVARYLDHITYHAIIDSDIAVKKVIAPLEKISGWNEEDEKFVEKIAEKIKNIPAKTIKEKTEMIKNVLEEMSSS